MRAAAKVDEFPGGVERNHRLSSFFLHELALENLIGFFIEVESFRLGNQLALVRQVLSGKLMHLFLNVGEVFLGKRLVAQKFVEKADRKSTRLNSSHRCISYAVFCLKKKND